MEREADLIRSQSWEELRQHYTGRAGTAWESAWLHLLRLKDKSAAIKHFKEVVRDPHFEEAAAIMLWKLGAPMKEEKLIQSPTLRLYLAFSRAQLRPWGQFFQRQLKLGDSSSIYYVDSVLDQVLSIGGAVSKEDLEAVEQLAQLGSNAWLFLSLLWDRRLKDRQRAAKAFEQYLKDPWVEKILQEARRYVLDFEMSKRVQYAYAQKDGLMLQRLLKAQLARLRKLSSKDAPLVWRHALEEAIRVDSKSITENLLGFEFWEKSEWSPRALHEMKKLIFPEDGREPLGFMRAWNHFLNSKEVVSLPEALEPDSRALWQIRVEIDPSVLSKALLRFPSEERFLFLWTIQNPQKILVKDQRQWPSEEKESSVVRENLKRAFERSSNKALWFNRLRQVGCSQDFYEYVLKQIDVPLSWVLDDLDKQFLRASALVRQVITDRLSVVAKNEADSQGITLSDLQRAFAHLTPGEKQAALLSRYVLEPVPVEIIDDEVLDLFWEARPRIGEAIESSWLVSITEYLKQKDSAHFGLRHWRWVYLAWQFDAKALETFSPKLGQGGNFPWSSYFEAADLHQREDLILTCLPRLRDDRLRREWIETLLSRGEKDHRLYQAIQAIEAPHVRLSLLASWHEEKGEYQKAFIFRKEQLEETPVLNEQAPIYKQLFSLIQKMSEPEQKLFLDELPYLIEGLQSIGMCDFEFMKEASQLAEQHALWEKAWQWALQEWMMSPEQERFEQIDRLLDLAFRARRVDEAQRLLVDLLFLNAKPNELSSRILKHLLEPTSLFRLRHLRTEFIYKVGNLFPLRQEILRKRAAFDYRAVLLWDCFYATPLEAASSPPEISKKRHFELWGMTEALTQKESFAGFSHFIEAKLNALVSMGETHEYRDAGERLLHRIAKQYRLKLKPQLTLKRNQNAALKMSFDPPSLSVDLDFFHDLDEEIWTALCTGYVQAFSDWQKGLYEPRSLIERFFQALLLSGSPIAKVARVATWLALFEKKMNKEDLQLSGEALLGKLPFLNQLLILYLSEEFQRKALDLGLRLR